MSLLHGTEEVRALHASTCYGMERYRNGALDETESRSRQSSFNIRTWPDKSSVMQNCCNVSCSAQAAGNNRIAVQMAGFTGTMDGFPNYCSGPGPLVPVINGHIRQRAKIFRTGMYLKPSFEIHPGPE